MDDSQLHTDHRKRLRERFARSGAESLSAHELLELALFYAIPRQDTNALAHRLTGRFGSLAEVLKAPPELLKAVNGCGEGVAFFLSVLREIVARASQPEETVYLRCPLDAVQLLRERFFPIHGEHVFLAACDARGRLLFSSIVYDGSPAGAAVSLREIVTAVLACKCSCIVVAHNHPSGVCTPSPADIDFTYSLTESLIPLGVDLLDHIVLADVDYVSMAERGYVRTAPAEWSGDCPPAEIWR